MKIVPVVAVFHADRKRVGRTDITKLIAFRNYADAPEKKNRFQARIRIPLRRSSAVFAHRLAAVCSVSQPFFHTRSTIITFHIPRHPYIHKKIFTGQVEVYSGEKNSVTVKLFSSKRIYKESLHTKKKKIAG